MRHISGHCGHSEAHYKHLHIINNIMIKMPTVKMQDKGPATRNDIVDDIFDEIVTCGS